MRPSICVFTSFVYGLLSPETAIRYDRMEGAVQLPDLFDGRLFDYWRDRLTPYLIEEVKRAGGTLLFLASDEMRGLFHWAERACCARHHADLPRAPAYGTPQANRRLHEDGAWGDGGRSHSSAPRG